MANDSTVHKQLDKSTVNRIIVCDANKCQMP